MDPAFREEIIKNYRKIWNETKKSAMGMGFIESTTPMKDLPEDQREARLEEAWQAGPAGGFKFM